MLADGPVGQAGGLLGRLAECVLTSAHERAAGSVMRAQAVLDTATAAQPQTEFIAETAATDAPAGSSPAIHNAPSGSAGGREFGLESP